MKEHILVIGAGSSGIFTAIELAARGFEVTLADRGLPGSGTSGKFHGVLHSGARYAVTDEAAAVECSHESSRIVEMAPHCVEKTGGMIVSLSREEEAYGEGLMAALRKCSIEFTPADAVETVGIEPKVSRQVTSSILVPDNVLRGNIFLLSGVLTALNLGVKLLPFFELTGSAASEDGSLEKAKFRNAVSGKTTSVAADYFVNATGPWLTETSRMLGQGIAVTPAAGVMGVSDRRLSFRVISRMRPPSDGDIIVPYGGKTIAGTTSVLSETPSAFEIDEADMDMLLDEAALMVPEIREVGFSRAYASFRPLVLGTGESDSRKASRDFILIRDEERCRNLLSVAGGKMTTARLVGEKTAEATIGGLGGARQSGGNYNFFNPLSYDSWDACSPGLMERGKAWLKRAGGGPDMEEAAANPALLLHLLGPEV